MSQRVLIYYCGVQKGSKTYAGRVRRGGIGRRLGSRIGRRLARGILLSEGQIVSGSVGKRCFNTAEVPNHSITHVH